MFTAISSKMRRLLATLALSCLMALPAHGQTLLQLLAGAYDSDAQAYFNTLVANSCTTPSVAFKAAVSAYVVAEKAAGNWGNQDAEYILATADSCTASINLAQPNLYKITFVGSASFSVAGGYSPDGSTGFGDTGVNQSALTRQSQNNGHIEVYTNPKVRVFGVASSLNTRISTGVGTNSLNLNSATTITDPGVSGTNLVAVERTNSSTVTTYINGAAVTSASATSAALSASHVVLCSANGSVCPAGATLYFMDFGQVLNSNSIHYTNVRNLLIALGVTGI